MSKYKVIKPLSRSIPNGFETFTHGDLIEIEDEAEAKRMIEAGIVEAKPLEEPKILRAEPIETAVQTEAGVEKAVHRGKKEK